MLCVFDLLITSRPARSRDRNATAEVNHAVNLSQLQASIYTQDSASNEQHMVIYMSYLATRGAIAAL